MKQDRKPKMIGWVFLVFGGMFLLGTVLFGIMDRTIMDNIAAAVCACGMVLSVGFWAHVWVARQRLRQSELLEIRLQQLGEHWKASAR